MADCLQLILSLTLIRMPTVKQSQEDILANSIENLDVTEEVEDMEESWNKDQIQDLITLSGMFCFMLLYCLFACLFVSRAVGRSDNTGVPVVIRWA